MTPFAVLAVLMASSHAVQRGGIHRTFVYDPAQIQAWNRTYHVNAFDASQGSATKGRPMQTLTHVSVSGNFGGIFNVIGIGTATSQTESNAISVNTNRPLTFTANSFKPLYAGNSSLASMGSIMYSMALYQGTPTHIGSLVSGPVSGTDAGFSGQSLTLVDAQIPPDGNLVLVLTRTLTLTEKALGAYKLVGTGNIGVTIN